jgi:hypothetical protein
VLGTVCGFADLPNCPRQAAQKGSKNVPVHEYAKGTSNTGLRAHIRKYHAKAYIEVCEKNGWHIVIPELQKKPTQSQLDSHLHPVVKKGERKQFTKDHFLKALVDFIVADDQVCRVVTFSHRSSEPVEKSQSINVIECKEFHALLLLMKAELEDSDIPH